MPVGVRHADGLAPAVLEDQREHAEGGRDREQVEHDRLDRDHDRPERDEQQQERHREHEAEHERRVRREVVVARPWSRRRRRRRRRSRRARRRRVAGHDVRAPWRARPSTRRPSRRRRAAGRRCATVPSRLISVLAIGPSDLAVASAWRSSVGDGGLHGRARDVGGLDDDRRRALFSLGKDCWMWS